LAGEPVAEVGPLPSAATRRIKAMSGRIATPVGNDPLENRRLEGVRSSPMPEPERPIYPENSADKDPGFPLTSLGDVATKIQQSTNLFMSCKHACRRSQRIVIGL